MQGSGYMIVVRRGYMNTQFKKGVLEMLVLLSISKEDKYGYELVEEIAEAFEVKEGTIYPLLKRLTNEKYCDTYFRASTEGPARKYYMITHLGKDKLASIIKEWNSFETNVTKYIDKRWNNE